MGWHVAPIYHIPARHRQGFWQGRPSFGRLTLLPERELSQLAAGAIAKVTFKNMDAWFAFL